MRTNEERIAAMHKRADELKKKRQRYRMWVIHSASAVAGFAAVILLAVFVPEVSTEMSSNTTPGAMNASIFSPNGALPLIIIAVIAFFFGVTVTIFCFRLKKWREEQDRSDEDNL